MRSMAYVVIPAVLGAAAFATAPGLQAQGVEEERVSATALQVGASSRQRAQRWVRSAPVIHCAPAPLSERPGAAGELARPHIAPLEAAFLDALRAKRTLAARPHSSPRL